MINKLFNRLIEISINKKLKHYKKINKYLIIFKK